MSWARKFSRPIRIKDGSLLRTLKDGADFVESVHGRLLPATLQAAVDDLITAAEAKTNIGALVEQATRQVEYLAADLGRHDRLPSGQKLPSMFQRIRDSIARELRCK